MEAVLPISALCVFCGSSIGNRAAFGSAAAELGRFISAANITLVYGGGRVGLMGVLADSVLRAGGKVIGVMPKSLVDREIAHKGLSELHAVDTMHQRKEKMASLADAFLALPGGAGTLEELFEQWTWNQLGIHSKPCGVLNVEGYFDPLAAMINNMTEAHFLGEKYKRTVSISSNIPELFKMMISTPRTSPKWMTPE